MLNEALPRIVRWVPGVEIRSAIGVGRQRTRHIIVTDLAEDSATFNGPLDAGRSSPLSVLAMRRMQVRTRERRQTASSPCHPKSFGTPRLTRPVPRRPPSALKAVYDCSEREAVHGVADGGSYTSPGEVGASYRGDHSSRRPVVGDGKGFQRGRILGADQRLCF